MPSVPPKRASARPQSPAQRDHTVLRWAAVIDKLDYLSLLRLPRNVAPADAAVRAAYRTFSRAFHPDQYRTAHPQIREAAAKVFAAGAEAYRVLLDPLLRLRYMRLLAKGVARVPVEDLERAVRADVDKARRAPCVALVRTQEAREPAERADRMITMGELAYARTALEEALAIEPDNMPLAAKLEAVETKLFSTRRR